MPEIEGGLPIVTPPGFTGQAPDWSQLSDIIQYFQTTSDAQFLNEIANFLSGLQIEQLDALSTTPTGITYPDTSAIFLSEDYPVGEEGFLSQADYDKYVMYVSSAVKNIVSALKNINHLDSEDSDLPDNFLNQLNQSPTLQELESILSSTNQIAQTLSSPKDQLSFFTKERGEVGSLIYDTRFSIDYQYTIDDEIMGIPPPLLIQSLQDIVDNLGTLHDQLEQTMDQLNPDVVLESFQELSSQILYAPQIYQTEIDHLKKLINILKTGNPDLAEELNNDLDDLNGMDASSLTLDQLTLLTDMMQGSKDSDPPKIGFNEMLSTIPLRSQRQYWDTQLDMINEMTSEIAVVTSKASEVLSQMQEALDALDEDDPIRAKYEILIDDLAGKISFMENLKGILETAAAWGIHQSIQAGSLPDDFRHAILDVYMPGQEAYLEGLANLLYFYNRGAEIGNELLTDTLGFSVASNNYNFSNWLQKTGDHYSGSYSWATGQLDDEKKQVGRDLASISKAIDDIDNEISNVNDPNEEQLSESQKKTLTDQLNADKENLLVARDQLNDLNKVLQTLRVDRVTDDDTHFEVTTHTTTIDDVTFGADKDWATKLPDLEDKVVNGISPDPDDPDAPTGGLVSINTTLNANQQKYSDQGQNQQMILQMRMTQIQQEWTIIGIAMQAVNQAYMTFARNINK